MKILNIHIFPENLQYSSATVNLDGIGDVSFPIVLKPETIVIIKNEITNAVHENLRKSLDLYK